MIKTLWNPNEKWSAGIESEIYIIYVKLNL
jgi:hypothetical protein